MADLALADVDRMVLATSWGVAIAFNPRAHEKWNRLRARQGRGRSGLSGAELESAVLAIAAVDPSLVKIGA